MSNPAKEPAEPIRRRELVRALLNAVFIFLSLFLLVRTLFVEPFGVPTGSMATTFLGNHRESACPRCGFRVVVGEPGPNGPPLRDCACPNCGQRGIDLTEAAELPGDRLLVDKNVFSLRSPRRWEVAVFRCPVDSSKPYVKRVVGLPGEEILLKHGDVYANGELQRKTLAQGRDSRVLVFDINAAPADGWGKRWPASKAGSPQPPEAKVLDGNVLTLDAGAEDLGISYVNLNLDHQTEEPITDWLAYNGPAQRASQHVHDFSVTFDLRVSGSGSFAARLFDGLDSVFIEFHLQGGGRFGIDEAESHPLDVHVKPDREYKIELSLVDRRFSAAVDGKLIVAAFDLPANLAERKGVSRPIQFGARNAGVRLANFKLFRDIHYRTDVKDGHGTHAPWKLGPTDYYLLGDNSGNSTDSREWAVPGVPEKDFLGKPFLIHQPLKLGQANWPGPRQYQAIDWDRLRWVR